MLIRTFHGKTIDKTIERVKKEMGSDVVILQIRDKKKGLRGLFSRKGIEVTAAIDKEKKTHKDKSLPKELPEEKCFDVFDKAFEIEEGKEWRLPIFSDELDMLKDTLKPAYHRLIDCGMTKEGALKMLSRITLSGQNTDDSLRQSIMRIARCKSMEFNTEGPRVIAFIGPTGVGKTTTMAKIAAKYGVCENRSVALIAADVYRVGAPAQVKEYGAIMNYPVEVVTCSEQMHDSIEKHNDKDFILIDTAGKTGSVHVGEVSALVRAAGAHEVYLVLSVTTQAGDLMDITRRFSAARPNGLIFTKTDETKMKAGILEVILGTGLPVAYITMGQRVPEDIIEANGEFIAEMILGRCAEGWAM